MQLKSISGLRNSETCANQIHFRSSETRATQINFRSSEARATQIDLFHTYLPMFLFFTRSISSHHLLYYLYSAEFTLYLVYLNTLLSHPSNYICTVHVLSQPVNLLPSPLTIYCIVTIPFTFSSFYMYLYHCTMYMSSLNLSTFYPLLSLYSHYTLYF